MLATAGKAERECHKSHTNLWTQVTLDLARDIPQSALTLQADEMTGMLFKAGGRPVQLRTRVPPADVQQSSAPFLQLTCRAAAGIQVLQPKGEKTWFPGGLPTESVIANRLHVQFDGRVQLTAGCP